LPIWRLSGTFGRTADEPGSLEPQLGILPPQLPVLFPLGPDPPGAGPVTNPVQIPAALPVRSTGVSSPPLPSLDGMPPPSSPVPLPPPLPKPVPEPPQIGSPMVMN